MLPPSIKPTNLPNRPFSLTVMQSKPTIPAVIIMRVMMMVTNDDDDGDGDDDDKDHEEVSGGVSRIKS